MRLNPSEEDVIKAIMVYFNLVGVRLHRIVERIPKRDGRGRIVGRTSTPGMPDLAGWVRPRILGSNPVPVYIEAKRPKGKRRPAQEAFIAEAREEGVIAFFAESLDQAMDEMERAGVTLPRLWANPEAKKSAAAF